MYSYWSTLGYSTSKNEVIGSYYPPLVETDNGVFMLATTGNLVQLDSFESSCNGKFNSLLLSFWTEREQVEINIEKSYFSSNGRVQELKLINSSQLSLHVEKFSKYVVLHPSKLISNERSEKGSFFPSKEELRNSNRYLLEFEESLDCQSKENYLVLVINDSEFKLDFNSVKYRKLNK